MKKSVTIYILISSVFALLTIFAFAYFSISQFEARERLELREKQETSIKVFRQLLEHKGSEFRIVDGKLLAGEYEVNGNFELPDKIRDIFGVVATIFMGDVRVSTNVLNSEGKRALGTKLEGPAYNAIFKQGVSYRGEAPILGISYLTAYDPIRDKNGKVIGALFVGGKVSEYLVPLHQLRLHITLTMIALVSVFAVGMALLWRAMKRVEDANENQLKLQQTLIDTIPYPVYIKDLDGRYLCCNRSFEFYGGFAQNDVIGKTARDIWPAELAEGYVQQDLELLRNPGMHVYESRLMDTHGVLHDVIFNKATYEGSNGAVAGLVGIIVDITERKIAEEATRSAYQELFAIIEFLPDATFVIDMDKKVIAWNRAVEEMTGVAKGDILGRGNYEYSLPFYGERRPILIDLLDEDQGTLDKYNFIRREGGRLFAETSLAHTPASGEHCFLWATASPLFDQQGKRIGAIESIRDISEYKKAEEERSRLLSQLHHARMMETFMLRLGHDLRTPLTPLFVLFPMMRERIAEPELQRMLDICCKSATAMKKLVDRAQMLVNLSSLDSAEHMEPTRLFTIAEQAVAEGVEILGQKQIVFRNEIDPTIVVQAVPDQLRELFSNLISNAVRYSPGNGVVRITTERRDATVTVGVHDEGVGLDSDHLERIFDEFFKADESRHDLDAHGLGLSICKRIVSNHRGRIWAESPGIGKGTSVKFTINELNMGCR